MKQDLTINFTNQLSNHVIRMLRDLSDAGWTPIQFPKGAHIIKNRQLLELQTPHRGIRIRVSIFKVGNRGETHRLKERRIEITTTLASGLPKLRNWADVVLGYDPLNNVYVGLDPRRLSLGGKTHNASSSVDPKALVVGNNARLLIRPHKTLSLGLEYQAIFKPQRLGEYFFNYELIHDGLYRGEGILSGPMKRIIHNGIWKLPITACRGSNFVIRHGSSGVAKKSQISKEIIQAFEINKNWMIPDLTPGELEAILRKCREVGDGGESFVYQYERRRLYKAGRGDLAKKIDWVSQKKVGKGYDIKSFEITGELRFIEVKATIGKSATFFMSSNEWYKASRSGESYWIYRVVQALDKPRISGMLQDPIGAEVAKNIIRVADGWRVTILKKWTQKN